jgi:hypothetical protein
LVPETFAAKSFAPQLPSRAPFSFATIVEVDLEVAKLDATGEIVNMPPEVTCSALGGDAKASTDMP